VSPNGSQEFSTPETKMSKHQDGCTGTTQPIPTKPNLTWAWPWWKEV